MNVTVKRIKFKQIKYYKGGFKYQLARKYTHALNAPVWGQLSLRKTDQIPGFIVLKFPKSKAPQKGAITIQKGYAWDGATKSPDLRTVMRASLVHDALYQVLRNRRRLSPKNRATIRKAADKLFRDMIIADGTPSIVAQTFYFFVRKCGKGSADPKQRRKAKTAP